MNNGTDIVIYSDQCLSFLLRRVNFLTTSNVPLSSNALLQKILSARFLRIKRIKHQF